MFRYILRNYLQIKSIFYCTKARDPIVKVTNEMFGTTFLSLFSCGRLNIELSMDVCNVSKLLRVSFISKGKALWYKSLTKNTSVIFETQFTTECDLRFCFWVTHIFCWFSPWITWTSYIMSRRNLLFVQYLGINT